MSELGDRPETDEHHVTLTKAETDGRSFRCISKNFTVSAFGTWFMKSDQQNLEIDDTS